MRFVSKDDVKSSRQEVHHLYSRIWFGLKGISFFSWKELCHAGPQSSFWNQDAKALSDVIDRRRTDRETHACGLLLNAKDMLCRFPRRLEKVREILSEDETDSRQVTESGNNATRLKLR